MQAAEAIPDKRAVTDAASGRYDLDTGEVHELAIEEKEEIVEANRETLPLVRHALT